MKSIFNIILILLISLVTVSCTTQVQKQDHYVTSLPNDSLLQKYYVNEPPMASTQYSTLTFDQRESVMATYIVDLLQVIGWHNADKSGLSTWKETIQKDLDQRNKEAENKK